MLKPWIASTLVAAGLALLLVPGALADVTEFPLPHTGSRPYTIVAGPDGNLWFTESDRGTIGRITPSGTITEFPLEWQDSGPYGITVGADGNLWFTERFRNQIGKITTPGTITEYPHSDPGRPALGHHGASERRPLVHGGDRRPGRVHPSERRDRRVPERNRPVPDVHRDRAGRQRLVHRGDREQHRPARSGRTPRPDGLPALTDVALPWDISAGPDGNLWFTELAGRHIGKITLQGDDHGVSGRRRPRHRRDRGRPSGDTLWFTENDSFNVGEITSTATSAASVLKRATIRLGSRRGLTGTCGTASGTATRSGV